MQAAAKLPSVVVGIVCIYSDRGERMRSKASIVSSLVLRLVGCASMRQVLRSTTLTSAPQFPKRPDRPR